MRARSWVSWTAALSAWNAEGSKTAAARELQRLHTAGAPVEASEAAVRGLETTAGGLHALSAEEARLIDRCGGGVDVS